jgi:15-cis-phytoene synthase
VNVEDAYRECEAITSSQARNFAYGIRLLPRPKRRAMSALYALARRIDDIGDGEGDPETKIADLARVHFDIGLLRDSDPPDSDAVLVAMNDVVGQFPLPLEAIDELVDGCQMDVEGTEYKTFEDLVEYCRKVAGTVGRLSLSIYGCEDPDKAIPLADDLGVALQITNILRDIVEDHSAMGRVYLPLADRQRFGVPEDLGGDQSGLVGLIAFETGRAEEWYTRGLQLLPLLDWRSRACTAAMAGIYHKLLVEIQSDPSSVLNRRVSLRPQQKLAVAARALSRGAAA